MHRKINEMPREWPFPRKGKKYIAFASHNSKKSLPLLYVLRDLLKFARTMKEVKKICLQGDIKINQVKRIDPLFPVQTRDIVSIEKIKKNYILLIKEGKFFLEEIDSKNSSNKIIKIKNKKILSKDKIQVNLEDGTNILYSEKCYCGDSAVLDLKNRKIEKILPLKEKAIVEVIKGKHLSKQGKIVSIQQRNEKKFYEIKLEEGKNVFLPENTLLVIG